MSQLQEQWEMGYRDGWSEQGVSPTSDPTIPPAPDVPPEVSDPDSWMYASGKSRGTLDRMKKQAGI